MKTTRINSLKIFIAGFHSFLMCRKHKEFKVVCAFDHWCFNLAIHNIY